MLEFPLNFMAEKENTLLILSLVAKINVEPRQSLECPSSEFLYTVMLPGETASIWEQRNQTRVWLRVEGGGNQ